MDISINQFPEQAARDNIDKQLHAAGWAVQDKDKIDWNESIGIAIRGYQTDVGPTDYVLFVERRPVGLIEAKKEDEGLKLITHEPQAENYAASKLKYLDNDPLSFVYESTGTITRFTDYRDPKPRSRFVFTFHRPETFKTWLKDSKSLRVRLLDIPGLPEYKLRDCQIKAINNLEKSFKENKPRALVQMATGAGKTYTAITSNYRLLKFANAYQPSDDNRKFTELYNVQRLQSNYISPDSQVCICTIQRLYSILKGDVKSKGYFEQMKGRGTRTFGYDDLKKVTPSALSAKTHFVVVDAVGVTKSVKTDSRPLERKRSTPLKELLDAVTMGVRDEDLFTSLAGRLARLEKQLTDPEKETFEEKAKGKTLSETVKDLLNAYNPDKIEEKAQVLKRENPEITKIQALEMAKENLSKTASSIFTGELNGYIENVRRVHEQIIDNRNSDNVTKTGWSKDSGDKDRDIVNDFSKYMEEHKDEIIALSIFYDQPYRLRELTSSMVKDVLEKLRMDKPLLAPLYVWQAYEQLEEVNGKSPKSELVALVSLIRRVTGMDDKLTAYDKTVDRNFQKWVFEKQAGALKFNEEQMDWLRMMKEHIATSFHIEVEDLDYTPFDAHGGRGMMFQLFGSGMNAVISEMNEALAV